MTTSSATETETAVKERPIIMSGEMIRAILDGRKSMTRRVIKPQPDTEWMQWLIDVNLGGDTNYWNEDGEPAMHLNHNREITEKGECPYGKPGDRLWLRETWAIADIYDKDSGNQGLMPFGLSRSTRGISIWYKAGGEKAYKASTRGRWRSPIFMPRAASRITLEVTGVRVERINRISLGDIEAEGTPEGLAMSQRNDGYARYQDFRVLWNTINQKRGYGWDQNPFVWCISFKVVQP